MPVQCPDRQELSAYVLGKLPENVLERLAHHAASCSKCQATLVNLDTQADSLISHIRQPRPAVAAEPALRRFLHQAEAIAMQPAKSASQGPELIPVAQFLQCLSDSDLFGVEEVKALVAKVAPTLSQDTRQLAQELVKQGKLTRFQAQMLVQGKTKGLVLGNYIMLDKIGQGGMGMVYKARHKRMNRIVALKVLSPTIVKNANAVQRFQREVEAAAKLTHPHIVAAHDADEAKGVHFLVMEYVEGSNLSQLVKDKGPLPVGAAVACIAQAARGLEHAHASRIIHRDIKPGNLFLDKTGAVKILDMGLARFDNPADAPGQQELTQTGSVLGTCDYMAPEQALNTKLADAKSDIYSLGCSLFYLLTGHSMYGGETHMERLLKHREEPIPSLRGIRAEVTKKLDAAYHKMVAKEPRDRYPSMTEVIKALEACGADHKALKSLLNAPAAPKPALVEGADTMSERAPESLTDAGTRRAGGVSPRRTGKWKWIAAAVAGLAAAILFAVATFTVKTDDGTFIVETSDPDVAVAINQKGGIAIHDQKTGKKFYVKAGKAGKQPLPEGNYEIEVTDPASGLTFETRTFTIKRGEEKLVKVSLDKTVASGGRQPPVVKDPPDLAKLPPDLGKLPPVIGKAPKVAELDWNKLLALSGTITSKGVRALAFAPDQQSIAAVLDDNTVRIFNRPANNVRRELKGNAILRGLAYSPDAMLLATADEKLIRLWDPAGGEERGTLTGHANFVQALAFSPDGKLLASASEDGTARIWDVQNKQMRFELRGHTGPVRGVAFSPDGQTLASAGGIWSEPGELILWNPATGQRRHQPLAAPGAPLSMAFSPDGSHVAVATRHPARTVQLYDVVAGRPISTLPELTAAPVALAFLPDGKTVAVGMTLDKDSLEFWDLTTRQRRASLPGHPGGTAAITVSSDGKTLATGGRSGGVNLYDLPIRGALDEATVRRIQAIQKLPASEQVKEVAKWLQERNPGFDGSHKYLLKPKTTDLMSFTISADQVTDLSPLRGFRQLSNFYAQGSAPGKGKLADLTPLQQVQGLAWVDVDHTQVVDLRPLAGHRLRGLSVAGTQVSDLSPIKEMPLTLMNIQGTPVADLSLLVGMKLESIDLRGTRVTDLAPLQQLPLQAVYCDLRSGRDAEVLRAIPTLKLINNRPPADFLKQWNAKFAAVDQRIQAIQKLPAKEQVDAVAKWLQELNPGFDGKVTHQIAQGAVTELEFASDSVSDLSPVRALLQLRQLRCSASGKGKGKLKDLEPLRGLQLRVLTSLWNPLTDLSPLAGMPIDQLYLADTDIHDLTPLQTMPLRKLGLSATKVTDLSPLRGMPLEDLNFNWTKVKDLAPLQGLPLTKIAFLGTPVADLTPLRWLPLETINGEPTVAFWKKHDPAHAAFLQWIDDTKKLEPLRQVEAVRWKLQERNPGYDGRPEYKIDKGKVVELRLITDVVKDLSPVRALADLEALFCHGSAAGKGQLADLSPLRGLPLRRLECFFNPVADLSPLRGMSLTLLETHGTRITDLSPLAGMSLTQLNCAETKVADLTPLKGMPLQRLIIYVTEVTDLTPLQGMPLQKLHCDRARIVDLTPLRNLPLQDLSCDYQPARDAAILQSIKTLQLVNGKPAAEFWKGVPAVTKGVDEAWIKQVQALPAEKQVEAVAAKLKELNPGFDGKVEHQIEKGAVIKFYFLTDAVSDLSPVRALSLLREFSFYGNNNRGKVTDLAPLTGLSLTHFACEGNSSLADLNPLKGMPLQRLNIHATSVQDLAPLANMPLKELICSGTRVSNLSPLEGMPLKEYSGPYVAERDAEILRSIKTLEKINGKPAAEFWKQNPPKP